MHWARYFEERVETMPSSWIRRLEDERLAEQVARCYEQMPFYRRKLDDARVRPEQVRKVEDLPRLPFTTRDELVDDASTDPPFGGRACVDQIDVVRLELGASSESAAVAIAYTEEDDAASAQIGARTLWAAGARPDDLVLHCAAFGPSGDGVAAAAALEQTGATGVSVASGDAAGVVALWSALRPTGVLAASRYELELAEAAQGAGVDAKASGLAKLLVRVEESEPIEPARRALEEAWGVPAGVLYGVPEIWCAFAAECDERNGLHFLGHGSVVAELVDPSTHRPVPIEPGAEGELVYSHLEREATPLLRFRSGDLVSIVDTDCTCGRTGFRFQLAGRAGR